MLTVFAPAPFGAQSPGGVMPGGTPGDYALTVPAQILNEATAIRVTVPS